VIDHLVVGGDSAIGAVLAERLNAISTTRRNPANGKLFFDLRDPLWWPLPEAGVTYFCAGINGFKACETNPDAWSINVVGTVQAAARQVENGGKVVFLSSAAAETHPDTIYGGFKLATEIGFRKLGGASSIFRFGAVMRPDRVTYPNGEYQPIDVEDLVDELTGPFVAGLHRLLSARREPAAQTAHLHP
jgi:dTDP-4-dehydrorhamnose reductase